MHQFTVCVNNRKYESQCGAPPTTATKCLNCYNIHSYTIHNSIMLIDTLVSTALYLSLIDIKHLNLQPFHLIWTFSFLSEFFFSLLRILDKSFMLWSFENYESLKSRFRLTRFKFSKIKSASSKY